MHIHPFNNNSPSNLLSKLHTSHTNNYILFSGSSHTLYANRRCRRANSGKLSRRDCHDEEGVLWGVLPCGPDGGLCLHCTTTCTGPGVCSLWRPPLLPQVLEAEGKIYFICAMSVYYETCPYYVINDNYPYIQATVHASLKCARCIRIYIYIQCKLQNTLVM